MARKGNSVCECMGKSKEHKRIGENTSSSANWRKRMRMRAVVGNDTRAVL